MLTAIVIAAIVSIHLVSIHSGTVERCLGGSFHKKFPSPEGPGFATCFPWKKKSCCSPETTVELKKTGLKKLYHIIDWDYCGGLSEPCRNYLINKECFYLCDPNLIKWQTRDRYIGGVPICSDTCDKWFEACKNDKTYSEDWLDDYALYHSEQREIKPNRPCRTFAEIFQNGEGLFNKLWGPEYKYERSSNCMVFDFNGENPNDKVFRPVP